MYNELFDCTGKVAVVAGGAGLIGVEIVKGLSAFGARVTIAETNVKKTGAAASAFASEMVRMDITKPASVRSALQKVVARAGRLDIFVNCAYPRTKDWNARCEDVKPESWKKNVDDHLGGYFFCARAAAELMKKQGGGSIINFASIYGVVAPDFGLYHGTKTTMPAAYAAIKGGVIAFTRYLAAYYAPQGVRANVVSPGGVFDGQGKAFVKRYAAKTPLGRMASPRDLVGAVVFLSSEASAYVTGVNMLVDGGWTAW